MLCTLQYSTVQYSTVDTSHQEQQQIQSLLQSSTNIFWSKQRISYRVQSGQAKQAFSSFLSKTKEASKKTAETVKEKGKEFDEKHGQRIKEKTKQAAENIA